MEWFYDKNGYAVFFVYGDRIISRDGKNLCWVIGDCIYSLKGGQHIGWIEGGKVFDISNRILAFSRNANGLPYKPGLKGSPGCPGIPSKPGKPGIGGQFGRPGYNGYSTYDAIDYFYDRQ